MTQVDDGEAVARHWVETHYPADADLDARISRGRRVRLALTFGCAVLVAAAGGVATWRWLPRGEGLDLPVWARVAGLAVMAVGLAVQLRAVVRAYRSGLARRNRRSPTWALDRSQRRLAIRKVRGRAAYEPDEVPFLRVVAHELAQRWLLGVFGGLTLLQAGQLLGATKVQVVVAAVTLPLMLTMLAVLLRQIRLAERFLARTGA